MDIPMRVWRVGRDPDQRYLLIFLDENETPLPMTIGACEAVSIWAALQGEQTASPALEQMTHDLLCDMIRMLGGTLQKVVVDDYWHKVYYAKLHIEVDSEVVTVDARPSDAAAIALRFGAPLYVSDSVLEAANQPEAAPGPPQESPDLWDETEEGL
jgi:uncharacterized protein